MADVTDAGNGLVQAIAGICYPSGTGSASITGAPVIIYQGWPNAAEMRADLAAGKTHVSIFPRPGDKANEVAMGDMEWFELSNNGTTGSYARETRRQTRQFQITIWAARFDLRDPIASAIDAGLSALSRMTLADTSVALISYANSLQNDDMQKAAIYRRDLFYALNYATLQIITGATAIIKTTINTTGGGFAQAGPTLTLNP